MCWRNVIATDAFDTGPVQDAGAMSTRSGSGSENAPFARCPGSETVSAASPAVLTTFAAVVAVYSRSAPGVNAPNYAGAPSVSESVAGTSPPTSPGAETEMTGLPSSAIANRWIAAFPEVGEVRRIHSGRLPAATGTAIE